MPTAGSNESLAPVVTDAQLELVRKTVANGASADELKLYLYDCQRQGVHPLDRLLHFTKRGGKYTPVTSIDLMRTRAADTGEYAGSDDAVFIDEPNSASVTVYRLVGGFRCPFTATARWAEYYPGDAAGAMWRKMPATMLAKCAEALALRKGFPRQLAGLYAKEELDQAGESTNGSGYSVTAPAAAAVLDAQGAGLERQPPAPSLPGRVAPSVSGDSGQLPPGAVLITKVDSGTGRARAFVFTSAMSVPYDKGLAVYNDKLAQACEQRCQDGRPVMLALSTPASGVTYIKGLTDVETGEDHDDDPQYDNYGVRPSDDDIPF